MIRFCSPLEPCPDGYLKLGMLAQLKAAEIEKQMRQKGWTNKKQCSIGSKAWVATEKVLF